KGPMYPTAQPASRRFVRRAGLPIVLLAAALAAAPAAGANSYHVDLDGPAIIANATTLWVSGGAPAGSYTLVKGRGFEIHPTSGGYVPYLGWGVSSVVAPSGTSFKNSSISFTTCAPDASGLFISFMTDGEAPDWLTSVVQPAAGCTDRVWPAVGTDTVPHPSFVLGLRAQTTVFGASSAWQADLTRLVSDVQDNTPPVVADPPADSFTNARSISVPVHVSDTAAGPAQIVAYLDQAAVGLRSAT